MTVTIIYTLAALAFVSLFLGLIITISDFKKRYNDDYKAKNESKHTPAVAE